MFAFIYARIRNRRENEVTRAPNSQSQSRKNEPVLKQRHKFQEINLTKSSDFCTNEEK